MANKTKIEIIEEIKNLGLQGFGPAEIKRRTGIDRNTISKYLKQIGIINKSKEKKVNQEDFDRLWKEGKTDEEIAEYFNCAVNTVKNFRTSKKNKGKYITTRYFSQTDTKLNNEQLQMILGSLLGDMALSAPSSNRSKNSRLALVHSDKQVDLFNKKKEILGDFMGSFKLQIPKPDKRTGNVYKTWRGNSKAHKELTDIYNILYIDNIKTVTKEYLELINSPIALAYWFMDDGTNGGQIATNGFKEKEVDLLIDWLREKWNINATKQRNLKNFTIYITSKSRLDFELLIFPYVISSMYYKLKYLEILKAESV
jgi:DNA-binding CsgD family transcriptional regulator